jgi:mannose-6-phosphate isomerase-like protein (cupin superfamily)
MAQASVKPEDAPVYRDDGDTGGTNLEEMLERQRLTTSSWQVVSIPENIRVKEKGSYIGLTHNKHAQIAINVYKPGKRDEMHCHPGSEHIFMVVQGELHIRGINEGEDVYLKPGELVHIKAGHYYQLCNDTDDITVLCQVATVPAKKPPVGRRSFRRAGDKTAEIVNG